MEAKEYTTIDRVAKGWPSGEWDGEPDKVQWKDDATGMPCLAVRHSHSGHWCGYVGVSEDHPGYQKGYNDIDVDVHGGLTFAESCQPSETEATGICHIPGEGEPDHVWWFGFDCAHLGDARPMDYKEDGYRGYDPYANYKSLRYVKLQCQRLAEQLKAMA